MSIGLHPVHKLRKQRDRIKQEREDAFRQSILDAEASSLRREIADLGEEPCA